MCGSVTHIMWAHQTWLCLNPYCGQGVILKGSGLLKALFMPFILLMEVEILAGESLLNSGL